MKKEIVFVVVFVVVRININFEVEYSYIPSFATYQEAEMFLNELPKGNVYQINKIYR